jgi:hypothetical protein
VESSEGFAGVGEAHQAYLVALSKHCFQSDRVLLRAVDGLLAVAREFCSKVGGGGRGGLINCQYVYYCYYYDSL